MGKYSMKKLTAIAMCTGLMITASGSVLADGAATYEKACKACHMTGAAGSPKIGDKAAWEPRIAQGMDTLYNSSIKGKGAMPPKGGQMQLSDDEIKAAVDYMVSQSK
jgi:cytochrome c5